MGRVALLCWIALASLAADRPSVVEAAPVRRWTGRPGARAAGPPRFGTVRGKGAFGGARLLGRKRIPGRFKTRPSTVRLRLPGGQRVRAVWKTTPGFVNEVAAHGLSGELGFSIVPETESAEIGGRRGSLQRFVEGAVEARDLPADAAIDRTQVEELRVLDFLLVNEDRNQRNVLLVSDKRGGYRLWAIDHESSLADPSRAFGYTPRPYITVAQLDNAARFGGPISQATLRSIERASPERVAHALVAAGIRPPVVRGVLLRLERLKSGDLAFLELDETGSRGLGDRMAAENQRLESTLSPDAIARVDALVASLPADGDSSRGVRPRGPRRTVLQRRR